MRYDDRLATVLRLTPVGAHVARVQYRQLIDLLGSTPADARGELLDAAYLRLAETAASIAPEVRAAMLAEPALRLRSARLVAALAEGEPRVAEAALNAADLTAEEWADLIPALPPLARALAGTRADLPASARALLARLGLGKRALPAAQAQAQAQAPAAPTPAHPVDEIGAIVRRIERFRRHREAQAPAAPADSPRLPLGEAPTALPELRSFDFASDSEGRIVWCEADVAPMIIGLSLGETPGLYTAIRHHQPLRAIPVELAGAAAIAGTWQVDALPRFDPLGGRFIGYLGRFRRPAAG
ncbi:MAG TPA: sensor histidine kinase, partial [Novosphingobium sp.]|nr:sensor histidine kinase [Novosphingobium sp.]